MYFSISPILLLLLVSLVAAENYIVVVKPGNGGAVGGLISSLLGKTVPGLLQFTSGSFAGFKADLTPAQVALLRANSNVQYIEKDGQLRTWGVIHRENHSFKRTVLTQSPSTWGLERISQKTKALAPYQYVYDSTAGAGTCIYIIDSGIYTAHNDFGGRASFVQNFVSYETGDDLSGHGTAVAAAAAGTSYGVAKLAKIFSIKVCNQSGSCDVSAVVAGISAATNNAQSQQCPNGVVINLSLGGPSAGWQSVKDAIIAATQAGVFVVAAAGNDHANMNNYLPASAAGACAVGATDQNDAIWSYSNYGSMMAVFAPGVGIQTAGLGSPSASVTVDGTSMSAPYVAGLGAYLWAKNGKGAGSAPGVALCNTIKTTANANVITGSLGGSPNRLAYNGM
ncbi:uncharacterized protein PV09_05725 [Verruconis gallopava]|uniref:Peptidase S8/S53 domain-containing protein n=1 Tax=Verruconis gallopava TaxID=253628 RepID=A0A0D2A959_9PEZI|nr:uncharacterized protein PV09_05725 [Verruconis gallopava]KIW03080.1 hypothetical protein PV09_05725 [Verruconis gallopava]